MLVKTIRKYGVAVVACLVLIMALAGAAGASPNTIKPLSVCSIWQSGSYSVTTQDPNHKWSAQVWIQELKSSDGSSCNSYRSMMAGHSVDGLSHNVIFDNWVLADGGSYVAWTDWSGTLPASGAAVYSASNTVSYGCFHTIWAKGQIGVDGPPIDRAYATGPTRSTTC